MRNDDQVTTDRLAIEALIYDYAYRLDEGDVAGVADLLRDATLEVVHGGVVLATATGAEEVQALLSLHADHDGTPGTHHVTTNVCVEVDDDGQQASARSYITLMQSAPGLALQPVACGIYRDVFVKVGATWRFRSRRNEARLVGDLSHRVADADGEDARSLQTLVDRP